MFAHAVMVAICGAGTYHIFQHQSFSYMDEIFHIPQAQKYCNGTFSEVSSSNDDEFFNNNNFRQLLSSYYDVFLYLMLLSLILIL